MVSTSAIIGAYNVEPFIKESILSLAQEVDEIIVVDDASLDYTASKVAELIDERPDLRIVLEANDKNRGVAFTYNRAASLANGEYLVITGGDDLSVAGRVEKQLGLMFENNSIASACLPALIREDGRRLWDNSGTEFFVKKKVADFASLLVRGNYLLGPSCIVSREIFVEKLCGFREGLPQLHDFDLWLRLAKISPIPIHNERLLLYRKRTSSISASRERSHPDSRQFEHEISTLRSEYLLESNRSELLEICVEIGIARQLALRLPLDMLRAFTARYFNIKLPKFESEQKIDLAKFLDLKRIHGDSCGSPREAYAKSKKD